MPYITTDDQVNLYYEEAGDGFPIVWVHEFAGNHQSWEPQLQYFSRQYRCISFAARGYPPSDVPSQLSAYSQTRAAQDIICVLDALDIEQAHIVGLSMGGFATLHAGLQQPGRCRSLTVAGVGYGAEPEQAQVFSELSERVAEQFERLGSAGFAPIYAEGASRVQLQNKNPRGWDGFVQTLSMHDSMGAANTMRGVQARRPSLYSLEDRLRELTVPTLIVSGDEDDHCLQPSIFLKRSIPRSGLAVMPKTGHTLNLEEPDQFNQLIQRFLHAVECDAWPQRDPRATLEIMKVEQGE